MKKHKHHPETEAVRGGTDLNKKNGPLTTPIYQTSTFEVTDSDAAGPRHLRPTCFTRATAIRRTRSLKRRLRNWKAPMPRCSSLRAWDAITTSLLALLKSGDHVVAQRDIYGGATKFLSQWLPKLGIETTFVDTTEYDQHARAIRPNTKLLYLESPTNPTLRVVDLQEGHCAGPAAQSHHALSTALLPRPSTSARRTSASIWSCTPAPNILPDIPT